MTRKGKKGVSPVVATIMMIALTVILGTAVVVFVAKMGGIKSIPIATLSFEAWKVGDNYVLVVSHGMGDTLNTGELVVTVNGVDAKAVWNVPELKAGRSARATLGVVLNIGDEVAIVHEPSGSPVLSPTHVREILGVPVLGPTDEFLVTADSAVMENWRIEGGGKSAGYGVWVDNENAHFYFKGRPVTRITADRQVLTNLYQSRLEITASEFRATKVVVYATHVEGKAAGVPASWDGDEPVPKAVSAVADPNIKVPITNVLLWIVKVEAESATLTTYKSETEMDLHVGAAVLTDWTIKGGGKLAKHGVYEDAAPVYHKGKSVTETTASKIEAKNISIVKDDKWKTTAKKVIQEGARVLSTFTSGSAAEVPVDWKGDEAVHPSVQLLPDPTYPQRVEGMELVVVYISSYSIILTGMEQSVIS